MSQTALAVTVITAADLRRALRVGRSTAYRLLHRAGAVRVGGGRPLRLPLSRLSTVLGQELAQVVVQRLAAERS